MYFINVLELKYTGDRYFSICILEYVYEQKLIYWKRPSSEIEQTFSP